MTIRTSVRPTVHRLAGSLGAEVTGVDLAQLDDDTFEVIKAAFLAHCVLVIPGKELGPGTLRDFASRFGTLHTNPAVKHVPGYPEVVPLIGRGKKRAITEVWHSDGSYEPVPPSVSILHPRQLPRCGGDTLFANQYLAFDRLHPRMQAFLERTPACHYGFRGSAVHPSVITHPETGRNALYLGAGFTQHFEGWSPRESAPLLDQLVADATTPDLTFRHRWSVGDVVMWDNRCALHYAIHDYGQEHRVMHRITVEGSIPRFGGR